MRREGDAGDLAKEIHFLHLPRGGDKVQAGQAVLLGSPRVIQTAEGAVQQQCNWAELERHDVPPTTHFTHRPQTTASQESADSNLCLPQPAPAIACRSTFLNAQG